MDRLTTEMGKCRGWENSTGMPTPAKTTLNVLYRLTTEMREGRGCENTTGMPTLAKTTLNVPYWLTTQMGPAARDGVTGLLY